MTSIGARPCSPLVQEQWSRAKKTDHTIGVDISKSHLDAFRLEDGAARQFENASSGFRAFAKWLGKLPLASVVFEPTGPYHKAFEAALGARFLLVKVNPLQARRFAEASGTRAKTDAVPSRRLETNRLPGNRCPDVGAHGGGVRS